MGEELAMFWIYIQENSKGICELKQVFLFVFILSLSVAFAASKTQFLHFFLISSRDLLN